MGDVLYVRVAEDGKFIFQRVYQTVLKHRLKVISFNDMKSKIESFTMPT